MTNLKLIRFAAVFLLMGMLFNSALTARSSNQGSKDSATYIGIKDKSKWAETNLFRVPFKNDNGKWRAMPHSASNQEERKKLINLYPKTIAFSPTTTVTRLANCECSGIGSYNISSDPVTPVISSKSPVCPKRITDVNPTDSDKQKVAAALKQMFPTYTRFDVDEETEKATVLGKVQWTISDLNFRGIKVDGYTLIVANGKPELETGNDACFDSIKEKGTNSSGVFLTHWYVMILGTPVYLGKEMELLECADYGNNNTTQFIFRVWGYNGDGYYLFSNNFKYRIEFTWSYH